MAYYPDPPEQALVRGEHGWEVRPYLDPEQIAEELEELFAILNVPGESDSHVRHKVKRRIRRLAESLRSRAGGDDG